MRRAGLTACWSLAVAIAIWVLFSWPLPTYVTAGISSSSLNVEKGNVRAMIPGDHLQFLYQFWLADDTLRGNTPAFHNPYEFNAGNDADRQFRGTYYVPFSLFYAVGAGIGGRAFGYNVVQIVTLWITFLFTWLLVRRYNRDDWLSAVAAVVGIMLPYFWITTLDGSPTGLAMMFVPLIYWGLDVMMVERKLWAGAVAGLGILLAESDTHVLFFSLLTAPFWCLFSFLFHFPGRWPSKADVASILRAAIPLLAFLAITGFLIWHIRHGIQDSTLAATGRSAAEITFSSPSPAGVFRLANVGEGRKIYVGGYLAILLLGGLGGFLWSRFRRRDRSLAPWLPVLLLGFALMGVVLLSTGMKNPAGPGAWKLVMKLIPPYAMIRQPHKIYCLMPVLLALATGILWPYLLQGLAVHWRKVVAVALLAPVVLDYSHRIQPTVCLLEMEQGAFRTIAEDAEKTGNSKPLLLSLPLWPGNSHYDSLNEYYVSLYRLRMVNGYGGSVKKWFWNDIVLPFESLNVGGIEDSQLDALQKRGVGYLVLHENCFPEKVSPFPVGYTLQALLNQPRLKCIGKDAAVWAFKILPADQAEVSREKVTFMKYGFPAKRREFERSVLSPVAIKRVAPSAISGGYVSLSGPGASAQLPTTMVAMEMPLSWLVRAKGRGNVGVSVVVDGVTNTASVLEINSEAWGWWTVAIPSGSGTKVVSAGFSWDKGSVDLDSASMVAGSWVLPAAAEAVELPAACFFHAGYTERDFSAVVLRKDREPVGSIFYGLGLPLEEGRYTAELVFDSNAPAGTQLGTFSVPRGVVSVPEGKGVFSAPVVVGSRALTAVFSATDVTTVSVAFSYDRTADIRIRGVRLVFMPPLLK